MSRDVFIIHSTQCDDREQIKPGYYVAEAYPEESVTKQMFTSGPYATMNEAYEACVSPWIGHRIPA
jgi:hypothetical protein